MSNKHKPIYAYCVYHVAIVPKTTAREFYSAVPRSLCRCVEAAAGKIEGVRVGRVDVEPTYMHFVLLIPPQYAASEVISKIKMRTHALVRKAAISKGLLGEKDDYKTWIPGYFVTTRGRNDQEIADYVKAALADDERMAAGKGELNEQKI